MRNLAHRAREATGLSQQAFGQLLNVTQAQVSRWEREGAVLPAATLSLMVLIKGAPESAVAVLSASRGVIPEDLGVEQPSFRGDGGAPPGHQDAKPSNMLDGVPDYEPDFGFVGGQEEPGYVPPDIT